MQEKGITRYLGVLASMKQKLTHRRTKKPDRPPDGNLGTGTKAKVLLQGLQLIRMEYDFLNGNTNMVPSRKKKWVPVTSTVSSNLRSYKCVMSRQTRPEDLMGDR